MRGADVSKVSRVYNDLYVSITAGDPLQDFYGPVCRAVIDEKVLILVAADFEHLGAHAVIEFFDITFFVVTGSENTDGAQSSPFGTASTTRFQFLPRVLDLPTIVPRPYARCSIRLWLTRHPKRSQE